MDSDSEIQLANTLTPNSQNAISQNGEEQLCPKVWGRLYPRKMYLEPVDLLNTVYLFGRGLHCDVVFSHKNFQRKVLDVVSKVHFKITLEEEEDVFIEDYSKNGTFVNNSRVKKSKVLLQNDDEISIGITKMSVYVFKKFKNEEDSYLPPGLRNIYIVSRVLGQGAFGEVRLAFSKATSEQFAIKKIIKGKISLGNHNGLNSTTHILNEAEILKSLSHPCIIRMHGMLENNLAVFMVLEYMAGGELTRLITSMDSPLTEARSKLIFYQIVMGVQYLHRKGITHRDLKPGNILLKTNDPETLVKVSDFGLSKIVHDNVFMATICGTPVFVAPEVIDLTQKTYTHQIDIWSLGVILYYMLSKQLPFNAQLRSELVHMILNAEYEMDETKWRNISDSAKCVVNKMLVKDPQKRIQIDAVANHPWFNEDGNVHQIVIRLMKEAQIEGATIYFSNLQRHHFDETVPVL